jgi:hypothetical protein
VPRRTATKPLEVSSPSIGVARHLPNVDIIWSADPTALERMLLEVCSDDLREAGPYAGYSRGSVGFRPDPTH